MKYLLPVLVLICMACNPNTTPTETDTEAASVAGEVMATDTIPPSRPVLAKEDTTVFGMPPYEYLTGKFDPGQHPDFVKVAARYTDGDPYLLHRETYAAFEKMHAAAMADGVQLIMVSATRNFQRQRQIWEAKWKGQRLLEGKEKADEVYPDPADRARAILRYSSMPGTSRHHWGTDIDLNALTNEFFDAGKGKEVYDWLVAHAHEYGFCQPYTPKGADRPSGYEEERWHWSYLPLATQLTDFAASALKDEDISGFEGAEAAPQIGVINNYVLGINPDCKE
ncbi:M15 family metallopeptidase [Lewinella sp. W8]|uniref:M15 family metallopeptidase n=1 Tax=Lewinella sp. W8 TaxID=2528208 RepID=UPI001067367A|nr:M15 family metallopeptidase [Lewinella sp. W8]MTB50187.1 D-alanyl-D-alanine carboxypeptidase family protein [Lewinella sp. W8]